MVISGFVTFSANFYDDNVWRSKTHKIISANSPKSEQLLCLQEETLQTHNYDARQNALNQRSVLLWSTKWNYAKGLPSVILPDKDLWTTWRLKLEQKRKLCITEIFLLHKYVAISCIQQAYLLPTFHKQMISKERLRLGRLGRTMLQWTSGPLRITPENCCW